MKRIEKYLGEASTSGSLDDMVKQLIKRYGDVKKAKEETIKAITKEATDRAVIHLRSALLGTD